MEQQHTPGVEEEGIASENDDIKLFKDFAISLNQIADESVDLHLASDFPGCRPHLACLLTSLAQ